MSDWRQRCDVCNWPLGHNPESGCVVGNCAYRGKDKTGHIGEQEREIRIVCREAEARVAELEAENAGLEDENAKLRETARKDAREVRELMEKLVKEADA